MFADLAVSGVRKPLSAATLRLLRLSRVERTLALYGGHLVAGPQPGGGFAVRVDLPVAR